jgi:FkbM family methyltransferase
MNEREQSTAASGEWKSANPLPSVRLGRRIATTAWPRRLEWLRDAIKRLSWTAVEMRLVDDPVRFGLRELLTRRTAVYGLRNGTSRFTVRHHSGDIDIFRKFYAYGYYDIPELLATRLRGLGRPLTVVDLGANIGLFETFTRDRLSIGHVTCLEPDPYNRSILEQTRAANSADWDIVAACASNRAGEVLFNTGRKNLSRIGEAGDMSIPAIDVFPYVEAADLVKMNIEGSEWEILADERLAGTSLIWIVEYHAIANPEPDIHGLVTRLFERAGYQVSFAAQSADINGLVWAWKA